MQRYTLPLMNDWKCVTQQTRSNINQGYKCICVVGQFQAINSANNSTNILKSLQIILKNKLCMFLQLYCNTVVRIFGPHDSNYSIIDTKALRKLEQPWLPSFKIFPHYLPYGWFDGPHQLYHHGCPIYVYKTFVCYRSMSNKPLWTQ